MKTVYVSNGSWFLPALALAFIILKLTGVIAWSWWWILAPLWIPFAIVLSFRVIIGISFGIYLLVKWLKR